MSDRVTRVKELERYSILIGMLNFLYGEESMAEDERITTIEYNEIRKKMRKDYRILSDVFPWNRCESNI